MKVLILAAGYGRRLYPLTRTYPKPLLLVKERPIIDYILDKIKSLKSVDEVLVITNNKFIGHFKKWKRRAKYNKPIKLINDLTKTNKTRLGAVGDIHFAIKKARLKDDLLVVGGDNLFDENLQDFVAYAHKHRSLASIGVYDVRDKKTASHYGVVGVNGKNQIVTFQEKPARPKSSLVGMCLYYFPKEKLFRFAEFLNSRSKDHHDAAGSFINWLHKRDKVLAFVFRGRWYDIGQRSFYTEASATF